MKIKVIITICSISLALVIYGSQVHSKNTNNKGKKVQELKIRDGLPNFFFKALHKDTVKVAYLGGSITAQQGWRVYSLNWFKNRFPDCTFLEINAAIGGTDSYFGAFRVYEQVIKYNPDLIFVEFAVNDSNNPDEKIIRSMEGIVHQIWQNNHNTDICFVYTIKKDFLEEESKGELPNSAKVMERLADHYGIPTINFGREVCQLVSAGQLIIKDTSQVINGTNVFSPDGVHPYVETGHKIYFDVFKRSLEKIQGHKPTKLQKHTFPVPLDANFLSDTKMIDISLNKPQKDMELINIAEIPAFEKFSRYSDKVGKIEEGGKLVVHFKGKMIGAYDIKGPGTGRLSIEIDGIQQDTVFRFDPYSTYWRMNYFLVGPLEDKEHEVVFRVLEGPFDKKAILEKRNNTMEDPQQYKENDWFILKILMDGSILYENKN